MKKKTLAKEPDASVANPGDLAPLIAEVRQLIHSARSNAASVVDSLQVMTNFEIGRRIVEHEQQGSKRAEYGAGLLKELSALLAKEFGKGFSARNLEYMRKFYLEWRERVSEISQTPSAKLPIPPKAPTSPVEFSTFGISHKASGKYRSPFTLSWSHYVLLLTIKDPDERSFYEIEATREQWSLSELKRQKAASLYQRLALSRDKAKVKRLATEGQIVTRPEDVLKEPYISRPNSLNGRKMRRTVSHESENVYRKVRNLRRRPQRRCEDAGASPRMPAKA
jgi:predicted nuclease of restriction endonuclease-like (RecB) superfamily